MGGRDLSDSRQVLQAVRWKSPRRVTPEDPSDSSLLGAREHGAPIVVDAPHVGQWARRVLTRYGFVPEGRQEVLADSRRAGVRSLRLAIYPLSPFYTGGAGSVSWAPRSGRDGISRSCTRGFGRRRSAMSAVAGWAPSGRSAPSTRSSEPSSADPGPLEESLIRRSVPAVSGTSRERVFTLLAPGSTLLSPPPGP
jgi:hypothetical protein